MSEEMFRTAAHCYYSRGAHGLATMNLFQVSEGLFKELREPEEVAKGPHHYCFALRNYDNFGGLYAEGNHVDNWGCVWKNIRKGLDSIVVEHPLDDWSKFDDYVPPTSGGLPHGFMYMRLYYLRGFENFMMDLIEEPFTEEDFKVN